MRRLRGIRFSILDPTQIINLPNDAGRASIRYSHHPIRHSPRPRQRTRYKNSRPPTLTAPFKEIP